LPNLLPRALQVAAMPGLTEQAELIICA